MADRRVINGGGQVFAPVELPGVTCEHPDGKGHPAPLCVPAPFGDTSAWTEEDHAAANAERERDLAALDAGETTAGPQGIDYQGPDYSQGYLDGLEDASASHARIAARRRELRRAVLRTGVRNGLVYAAAYAAGALLADWLRGDLS